PPTHGAVRARDPGLAGLARRRGQGPLAPPGPRGWRGTPPLGPATTPARSSRRTTLGGVAAPNGGIPAPPSRYPGGRAPPATGARARREAAAGGGAASCGASGAPRPAGGQRAHAVAEDRGADRHDEAQGVRRGAGT